MTCDLLDRQLLLDGSVRRSGSAPPDDRSALPSATLRYLPDLIQVRDLIVGRVDELLAAGRRDRRSSGATSPAIQPSSPTGRPSGPNGSDQTQRLGALAIGLTDKDGMPPCRTHRAPEVTAARVERLVADLVEPARAEALEDLGQGRRAFGIATSWVRGKLGSVA